MWIFLAEVVLKKSWSCVSEVSILYQQLKFDEIQNDYLTQVLILYAEVTLKKKEKKTSCLRRLKSTNFKRDLCTYLHRLFVQSSWKDSSSIYI